MKAVKKTKNGWVIETTNTKNGCLEEGGISGRREFYSRSTLERVGIDYSVDPLSSAGKNDPGVTWLEWLEYATGRPDKVLRKGDEIK